LINSPFIPVRSWVIKIGPPSSILIAKITKGLNEVEGGNPHIEIEPLLQIHNGPTYEEMTQDEIRKEIVALQDMGHKRLAIEAGEDPVNNPIEYILESINTIYDVKHKNGSIRRVNVNIAATTVENYKKLPIILNLFDQVPVSQDEKIKVKDVTFSIDPAQKDYESRKGVMRWMLSLNPAEKKEISYSFAIERPRDLQIEGL